VRLLSNLETDTEKLLQIVLTGQPELLERLTDPALRQLRQRIAIEHHLESLRPEQIEPYLRHRIEVAGGKYEEILEPGLEPIFYAASLGCRGSRACSRIVRYSRPTPSRSSRLSREILEAKARQLIASRPRG